MSFTPTVSCIEKGASESWLALVITSLSLSVQQFLSLSLSSMVWTGLKITRQLYCRLSFHLGLSDGSLWLDSGYTFLARSLTGVGFPCGSASKESAFNAGDLASIPGLGRSPGEGKGHPLQCSGLENPMDCIAHVGRKEPDTTERVSLPLFSHVCVCVCSLCSASG